MRPPGSKSGSLPSGSACGTSRSLDRKSTRLNSSHGYNSYAAFCLKQKHREFESYKITAYSKGDTVWIVGDWQGGRSRKFSGDFVINVPRNIDLANIASDGARVRTT